MSDRAPEPSPRGARRGSRAGAVVVLVVLGIAVAGALAAVVGGSEGDPPASVAGDAEGRTEVACAPVEGDDPRADGSRLLAEGFGEAWVTVGRRCLRVLVADGPDERIRGLRGVDDLGAHDGMVFVFDGPTRAAFTMGGTPMELDVAFYDDDGRLVARHRMAPCEGDGAGCPTYSAGAPFRYALEVPAGRLPGGSLVFTPGS